MSAEKINRYYVWLSESDRLRLKSKVKENTAVPPEPKAWMDQAAACHPETTAGMWEYLSEGKQAAGLLKNLLGLFILVN